MLFITDILLFLTIGDIISLRSYFEGDKRGKCKDSIPYLEEKSNYDKDINRCY